MDKENIISFLCADVNIVAEIIEKIMPVESSELYQEMAFLVYDLLSLVLCYAICSLNLKTHALTLEVPFADGCQAVTVFTGFSHTLWAPM